MFFDELSTLSNICVSILWFLLLVELLLLLLYDYYREDQARVVANYDMHATIYAFEL